VDGWVVGFGGTGSQLEPLLLERRTHLVAPIVPAKKASTRDSDRFSSFRF